MAAIDQGTTSTRCMIFDHAGREVARDQREHRQILPRAGWVEHDAEEIWSRTQEVVSQALDNAGLTAADLVAVGLTNQRETTVVWNPRTGKPYGNAIVWQDTRTDKIAAELERQGHGDLIRERSGLPPSTYFAGGKLAWMLAEVDGLRAAADSGEALFGTIDSWLLWNLTGGVDGGRHLTDVTNASRTMLMNLATLDWDEELLDLLGVPALDAAADRAVRPPRALRPHPGRRPVRRRGGHRRRARRPACRHGRPGVPGQGRRQEHLRDRQLLAAEHRLRRSCRSTNGLLTTVCYQFGDDPCVYALEGSIAVTGSSVQWLRDQLGILADASDIEALASQVPDTGGAYFVPAFSGLFAPYWRSDARGVIVGLSRFHTKAHLARAALEAICYQSRDVVEAMEADAGVRLDVLKVDGGVTANELCMQIQADTLGVDVSRPVVPETTALGAAYAAGLATGFWESSPEVLRAHWQEDRRWTPQNTSEQRAEGYAGWQKAIQRTLDWVEV